MSHLPPGRTRRVLLRTGYALVGVLALVTLGAAAPAQADPASAAAHQAVTAVTANTATTPSAVNVCDQNVAPHHATCMALRRTDKLPNTGMAISPNALPSGIGRSDLLSAYSLPPSGGSGQTVAIVDAYDDPNAESDLATYRSTYGLPACTTANGCFKKINQSGGTSYPSPDSGWAGEISLDLDMVSAVCPSCHILLVEATSANMDDLGAAVNQAVSQGAKFVSNSYGGNEDGSEGSSDSAYFHHPGVAITASSGDGAYSAGTEYPASSQYVTSVGGTKLTRSSGTSRGWTESVWKTNTSEGAGSGCSSNVAKPSWQHDTGCSKRMVSDVSAVADPATGVAVYQTYGGSGWAVYGGTSASAPIIASVYALAGTPGSADNPASYPYAHTGNLFDVTTGNNGSCSPAYFCTAATGYDGPTGLGSPNGVAAFTTGGTGAETVSVTNPGSKSGTVGTAVSLQISASDSAGKALTYSATGLPAGLSISSSGLISGTPTTANTYNVTVTASSGTASGSTTFTWTISTTGGGCTAAQLLGNAGFESGAASPWSLSSGLLNNSSDEPARSGSWDAWFDGYGSSHTDTASQSVTIPATCTKATLSFYLHIDTSESGSTAYDKFTVQVLNSSGTVLGTLATFSNANAASGYTVHSYDLSSYVGKAVTIKFTGTEDSSLQTSFVLDDNALNVS